jgi:hypothetical protein
LGDLLAYEVSLEMPDWEEVALLLLELLPGDPIAYEVSLETDCFSPREMCGRCHRVDVEWLAEVNMSRHELVLILEVGPLGVAKVRRELLQKNIKQEDIIIFSW